MVLDPPLIQRIGSRRNNNNVWSKKKKKKNCYHLLPQTTTNTQIFTIFWLHGPHALPTVCFWELLVASITFAGAPQQFPKMPKNTLMVFSVVNNRLNFSLLQCHFFHKISVTSCKLLPLRAVCKCIWSPVVCVRLWGIYDEFWSISVVGKGEKCKKEFDLRTDWQSVWSYELPICMYVKSFLIFFLNFTMIN